MTINSNQLPYSIFIASMGTKSDDVKQFYETFPRDFQISIKLPVKIIGNYLDLLTEINNCNNKNILIFSHGNARRGIASFRFSNENPEDDYPNSWQGFFWILHYCVVNRMFERIKSTLNIEDWQKILKLVTNDFNYNLDDPTSALAALNGLDNQLIVSKKINDEILDFKNIKNMPERTDADKNNKFDKLKKLISGWKQEVSGYQKRTLQRLKFGEDEKGKGTMNDYINEILKLQNFKLNNLAIRGCNIGCQSSVLEIYSTFFNVQNINAPRAGVYVGKFRIEIHSNQDKLREQIKNESIRRYGRKSDPDKWLGKGSFNKVSNPDEDNPELCILDILEPFRVKDSAQYYNPNYNPLKKNKNTDELFFALSNNTGRIIAEDFAIVLHWAKEKFGIMNPEIAKTIKGSNEMPFLCLTTFPYVFPHDKEFGGFLESKKSEYKNFLDRHK